MTPTQLAAMLDILATEPRGLTSIALAQRLSVSRNTMARVLPALLETGLIERLGDREVVLGLRAWGLGAAALQRLPIVNAAQVVMSKAVQKHGISVDFAIMQGTHGYNIFRIERIQDATVFTPTARRFALHASAMGKAILAFAPPSEVDQVLQGPLDMYTDSTLGIPADLLNDLETVRSTGYAITRAERFPGRWSVAVPIIDDAHFASSAVGAFFSKDELAENQASTSVSILASIAEEISRVIGYAYPKNVGY